ncbi:tetratricopeptide repeat protein [Bernardetia sp. OM2101]|uniref:tetratricopeptide repeat protein n=1 Tax=Bernardetia sp. OM2101 TaxID=3344876 RepID=UPI0035CFB90C
MKNIISIFLLIALNLLCFQTSFACINGETRELKDGTSIYMDEDGYVPHGHDFFTYDAKEYKKIMNDLDKLYKKTKDVDYLSDKGVILILQGKYQEAVNFYLELEKIKPNRYSTASNLGTAYELLGQNVKALFWIKKSVTIEPLSHNESEWLHINILTAKVKGKKYVNSDFLITTSFGNEEEPKTELSYDKLLKLREVLFFQLNERVSFIKDKNEIVALLLFELGNINLLLDAPNEAIEIYKKAQKYGFEKPILEKRLSSLEMKMNKQKEQYASEAARAIPHNRAKNNYLEIIVSVLFLLIITFFGARYIRNRKSKKKI